MSLKLRRLTLSLAILSGQAVGVFAQATVTVSPETVNPGDTVTVGFKNGPGHPKDWVALSEVGSPPTSSLAWKYVGPVRSGTVSLVVPKTAPAGTYEIQFRENDGFIRLATGGTIVVQPTSRATVTAMPETLHVGGTVTVSVSGAPGKKGDWVALSQAGLPTSNSAAWKYTGGVARGTVQLVVPRTAMPGVYVVRLVESDGFAPLATSNTIAIEGASNATVEVSPANVQPGRNITVSIEGAPGNPKDRVALSMAGSPPTSSIVLRDIGRATKSAKVQVLVPLTASPGLYEVRVLEHDGFVVLAKSGIFTVLAP